VIAVYLDASVILRVVLEQPPTLPDWETIELGVSSEIVRVECLRTIDRLRHERTLSDEAHEEKRTAMIEYLHSLELVAVDQGVLTRASRPFPTHVPTLDAIHLATALLYNDSLPAEEAPLRFATHDKQLARAARAMDLEVIGA